MAASSYLREYKSQLSYLLADERYSQRVFGAKGRERAHRDMLGELFVTVVPGEQFWLSVHDISEVDGEPVMDREDLRRLLERDTMTNVARALMERNARFNLGTVSRNFNEPTLALRLLEADRRGAMKFSRKNVTREDGATIVTLGFREAEAPTLVRAKTGRDLFSTGEIDLEAGTGRIHRTMMQTKYDRITAELTTMYAPEPKLQLWVPVWFSERYSRDDGTDEVILCEAEYTNYRRFETRVRIR